MSASGSPPFNYQWYTMSGSTATPIAGATSHELTVTPQSSTSYRVAISNSCGSLNSNTATITVYNPPSAPSSVTATSNGSSNTIIWSASSSSVGIDYYEVQRRDGVEFTVQIPGPRTLTNGPSGVTTGKAYLYRVRGVDDNGVAGSWSVYDLTTTMTFTDDPLQAAVTVVKGVHVGQLRQAIDAVRVEAGLARVWTNYGAETGWIIVGHVNEMRSSLNDARWALGLAPVQFAEPNLLPLGFIKAIYMHELRDGVK